MASQLPEESVRNLSLKPLNPDAKEFLFTGSTHTICDPQLGLPWNQCLVQGPPSMLLGPILTYYHPCFGFLRVTLCFVAAADRLPECSTEEDMGKKMIANTQRPPRARCMSQNRNQTAINTRRGHGNRWKVGNKVLREQKTSDGHPIIPFPTTMEECSHSRTTTVMIKNIPYYFQCKDLVSILDEHCSQQNQSSQRVSSLSTYDFAYLPMDYKKFAHDNKQSNLGYAFVNFTSARAAFRFFQQFNGKKWPDNENWKVCEVTKAQIQGKKALMKKFEVKVFRCGHPSFRPVEFRPARNGSNHAIKEISVGRFEEGTPDTSKPRTRTLLNQGKPH